jgi:hypothetical protein
VLFCRIARSKGFFFLDCRFLRSTQQHPRTLVSGWGFRAGQGIITCTRSTVTQPWMEQLSKCMMRWHLVTLCISPAFRSSKQPPYLSHCASVKTLSSSMTQRSSSPWHTARSDLLAGSWRQHTRLLAPIHLCSDSQMIMFRSVVDSAPQADYLCYHGYFLTPNFFSLNVILRSAVYLEIPI